MVTSRASLLLLSFSLLLPSGLLAQDATDIEETDVSITDAYPLGESKLEENTFVSAPAKVPPTFPHFTEREADDEGPTIAELSSSVSDLSSHLQSLSAAVAETCSNVHNAVIQVPRIESSREMDASLEVVRSYEQPTFYLEPGSPTLLIFPEHISGGYKRKNSPVAIDRKNNFLVLFGTLELTKEGEAFLVQLEDMSWIGFRVKPASKEHKADVRVKITR